MSRRTDVVITGIGVVSPNGVGRDAFARAVIAGTSGVAELEGVDRTGLGVSAAAQVTGFDPLEHLSPADARRTPRLVPMAVAAAREAMRQADLVLHPDDVEQRRRVGVVLGTGGGGLEFVEQQYQRLHLRSGGLSPFSITAGTHGNLSSELSIQLGLRGASHVLSTGCASSTDALGYARTLIRSGAVDACVCGGADAPIAPGILMGFEKMRVISTRRWDPPSAASRPFDRERDGFVPGEGAWMFVVERADRAKARRVEPLAMLAGYASTCDAFHRVQIDPALDEPVRAMREAIDDARLEPGDIDAINLHGTGTELNDRLESAAVRRCFGSCAASIPASSTKSLIGHPQGACGAAGVAATILAARAGVCHPTINLDHVDPECALDHVTGSARRADVTHALCNCIAFGSKNSAIVLSFND